MSLKSYLAPKTIETFQSQYNGEVTVVQLPKLITGGKPKLKVMAGGLLQSGSIITQLWEKPLQSITNYQLPITNVLLLGLGGGTIVKMLNKRFPKSTITAIEIDPVMITIAKKYYGLKPSKKLNIIQADAFKFVKTYKQNPISYDLIIVDLFAGDSQPDQLYTKTFHHNLQKLLSQNGIIIFNRLFFDQHKKRTHDFIQTIDPIYQQISLVKSLSNLFVIAKNIIV